MQTQTAAGTRLLESAHARAHSSVWIGGWSHVPVLGQPARWVRGATDAIVKLAHVANDVVAQVEPRLNTARDPQGRLRLLDTISAEFARLRAAVDAARIPASGWFVPPVDSADAQLRRELGRLRRAADDGAVASRGLHSFLQGPTTYLVLAANNAEMRAGGMVLQAGLLRAIGGRVSTGEFHSTAELTLTQPVAVPPEIRRLYGWLDPGAEWRNTGSSPDFPAVAPIYAHMALRKIFGKVDGAIQLDVPALQTLLEVVGPVDVAGRRYDGSNVERLIMHDLYVEFGPEQIQRRHHEFSQLAAATFQALSERRWDARALIKGLTEAASGRHLMLWSNRGTDEKAWRRLGVDGALVRNGLMVTVQNHTGNKLDWFLRPAVDVAAKKLADGYTRVTLSIRIANPTPRNEPEYIFGDGSIVPPGGYRAFVATYLPGWATNVELTGGPTIIVGSDGPMRVIGTRLDVPRLGTAILRVAFDAPPQATIELLPSGRFPATPVRVGKEVFDDGGRRSIRV